MSFYNGIINLILFGIFAFLDYKFFKLYKYEGYFHNFENDELLGLFGIMIAQFFLNLCLFFAIKNNTPNHAFIIYIFGQFAFLNFSVNSIIIIIYLLVILFLSLIFTEIIEINFCRLSYNTKRNISERAKNEDLFYVENETIDESSESNENPIEINNNEVYN